MFLKLLDGCEKKPIVRSARSLLEKDRKNKEKTTKPSKIHDNHGIF
jgi:hypothetical protein